VAWDSTDYKPVQELKGHGQGDYAFAVSPDQSVVLAGDGNGDVHLWDFKTGKKIKSTDSVPRTENPFLASLRSIDFSKNSKAVLLTSMDRDAILWDAVNWKLVRRYQGTGSDEGFFSNAIFNHDEKKAITIGWDGNIRVFEKTSGKELAVFQAHAKRGVSLASHPKKDRILSGGQDGKVIYWNLVEQKEITSWSFQGVISCLLISGDGKYACCTTKDAVHIWDLP